MPSRQYTQYRSYERGNPLSMGEFQAAWLYASGLSLKQVARRLGLSLFGVQGRIKAAYRKTGANSTIGLAEFFEREGAL